MTRVAIIPVNSEMKDGLWSASRSEGRVPLNWAALLGANGYDVVVPVSTPSQYRYEIEGVRFMGYDDVGSVDWVLHGTTSRSYVWSGLGTIQARRVVRLQWPTGGPLQRNGELLAVAHPCFSDQVYAEGGGTGPRCPVLPSPALPLSWWCAAGVPSRLLTYLRADVEDADRPRNQVVWAAREAFGDYRGTSDPWGAPLLTALERLLPSRGMGLSVLNSADYTREHGPLLREHNVWDRFGALGAVMDGVLPLGDVLRKMGQSKVVVTSATFKGPTIPEAIFEGAVPLIWDAYRPIYPELVDVASRFGVLWHQSISPSEYVPQAVRLLTRFFDETSLTDEYLSACRLVFSDNTPMQALNAWRSMEERFG